MDNACPSAAVLLVATTLPSFATFAYDGHEQTNVAYDCRGESAIGYDAVLAHATDEKKTGTSQPCVLFAKFTELFAPKGVTVFRVAGGPN